VVLTPPENCSKKSGLHSKIEFQFLSYQNKIQQTDYLPTT
jgi:hypothetical protein